jgi:hypothetical protein
MCYECRYERYWAAAIASQADLVTITSFNEWGEGTQIEAAVPRCNTGLGEQYMDYGPRGADVYMRLTGYWADVFKGHLLRRSHVHDWGKRACKVVNEDEYVDEEDE